MRLQYELANAAGKEDVFEEVKDLRKKVQELSDSVVTKNARVMRLMKSTKGLEHSLAVMKDRSRALLEAVQVKDKQLSFKKKLVVDWFSTEEGQTFQADLGIKAFEQGRRLEEEMHRMAAAKLGFSYELFEGVIGDFFDNALSVVTEEMKSNGDDGKEMVRESERISWEKILPPDLEARVSSLDFSSFDISTPDVSYVSQSPVKFDHGIPDIPSSRASPIRSEGEADDDIGEILLRELQAVDDSVDPAMEPEDASDEMVDVPAHVP